MAKLFRSLLILAALSSACLFGQTTVASSTIQDSTGQVWFGGSYTISFTPAPGFQGPYYYQGALFNPQLYQGAFDGSGHFSITLPSNNYITPSGSQWQFVLCSQTTAPCSQLKRTVTGASEDFTSDFSTNVTPPVFPAVGIVAYGYSTAEVKPIPGVGGFFFNVTTDCQNVWTGSAWYPNCGSSGIVDITATLPIVVTPSPILTIGNISCPSCTSSKRECEPVWGGSGSSFALQSGDDAIANRSCLNNLGATAQITSVNCSSDIGSNTTEVDPIFTGTILHICTVPLVCGSSDAYSTSCIILNSAYTSGSSIDPGMTGTLTGTSIHMVVTYTVPVL